MKNKTSYFFTLLMLIIVTIPIVSLILFSESSEAATCEQWVAKAVSVQGTVEVKRAGEAHWRPVMLNDTYCAGDTIRVEDKSRADLALVNQPVLRLDQGSTITLKGVKEERVSIVEFFRGAAHFFSRTPRALEVQTAFVNAGVEGTEFSIKVDEDRTTLSIFSGKVLASNDAGELVLTSGQSAVAEKGKAPRMLVVVKPRDAVQWTLYYPIVLVPHLADYRGLPDKAQAMIAKSIDGYGKGDWKGALDGIAVLPEQTNNARLFVYRASLLLGLGRAREAGEDLEQALSLSPNNSDALALRSIIQVTHNQKTEALASAKKAVEADQGSATAFMAFSYAQQANFDLKGALDSVQEATRVGPDNALAWARLSELWLSFGETKKAMSAAQRATSLDPNLARTQTVLGFAYLTEIKVDDAKTVFNKAIELDQTDPLARLGLGLAKIRAGDLEGGSKEIEIAASLSPNNSLVRSYLGKAYYEEKREKQASEEYRIAKELDPLDPTPYFYDAILKQTTNRPIEALHELQKAIELNDNRAVYRSKLLMDADLAARSASLGQIYNNLGFQQRALVEGWKSVNTDPADFSGHRFLADTYAVLPRHEIARVSELLQSQLLQPLNITPIQPRLAESNLLLGGGGPSDLSFNEFNPLFNRNRVAMQASGMVGENSTWGEEAVISGIYDKASFSLGQYYYETDGFRKNNDLKDSIINAFMQFSISPQTSIQGEYRYRNLKNGDLELNFFPDDYRLNYKEKYETNSFRLGLRHDFTPGSTVLGSFMYQHRDSSSLDRPIGSFVTMIDEKFPDQDAFSGEAQYLFRSPYVNLVGGIGYFNVDAKQELTLQFDPEFGMDPILSTADENVNHTNLYLYSYINPLKNLTLTLGASGDFFHTDSANTESKDQFNPKFGITWNPISSTTVRAAAFRVLKRTLITNQTLEPTQVAGFNQFFDDINSTESWVYGLAVDQKFSKNIYGGAEYSIRDLNVPFRQITETSDTVKRGDGREYFGRAYLFLTPHPWFALSGEYQYERFRNDNEVAFSYKEVTTSRVPLGLRFFHPSGLSALLRGTYYHQDGDFMRRGGGVFESGRDSFWIADAAISYRLPKRYGFITVGATNLFDTNFKYQETDPRNPTIQPDRFFYCKITLAFP